MACLTLMSPMSPRHHIAGLHLCSLYYTAEECLEMTASFPLLFSPTRHLPERFVMDHSLLCPEGQEMAMPLSTSGIKMAACLAVFFDFHSH